MSGLRAPGMMAMFALVAVIVFHQLNRWLNGGRRLHKFWDPVLYAIAIVLSVAVSVFAFLDGVPIVGWVYVGITLLWGAVMIKDLNQHSRAERHRHKLKVATDPKDGQ